MGQKDLAMRALLQQEIYFADLCNMMLFQGRQEIRAEQLRPMDTAEGISIDRNGRHFSIEKRRDAVREAEIGSMEDEHAAYVIIGIEHQSEIDYSMPVRSMIYDALQYGMQIQNIRERQKGKRSGREFLSGLGREDRLKPVITLIVYTGIEEWTYPSSLSDVLELEGAPEEIRKYIPNQKMPVLDVRHSRDLGQLHTGLKSVFQASQMYGRDAGRKLQKFLEDPANGFSSMPGLLANVFENLMDMGMPEFPAGKEVNMCEAVEELYENYKVLGLEEGKVLGLEEGKVLGLEEGKVEGKVQSARNIMESLGLTAGQALEIMKIPKNEQERYLKLIEPEGKQPETSRTAPSEMKQKKHNRHI